MHPRPSMLEATEIGDRGTTKADGIRGAGVSATSRKFLGCKRRLARWVADSIFAVAGKPASFIDGFCGTGAIGLEMLSRGVGHVTCVDNLLSNTVILDGVLSGPDPERLRCALSHLNAVRPQPGYATRWYADTYFTRDNCMRIDAIRPQVDQLLEAGRIGPRERSALLASLLLACDRVANTVGQYDAYLKHLGSRPIEGGRHLVDSRVYEPLRLAPLRTIEAPGAPGPYRRPARPCPAHRCRGRLPRPSLYHAAVHRQLPRSGEHRPLAAARADREDAKIPARPPEEPVQHPPRSSPGDWRSPRSPSRTLDHDLLQLRGHRADRGSGSPWRAAMGRCACSLVRIRCSAAARAWRGGRSVTECLVMIGPRR